jgi:hypothetical protein
MIVGMRFGRLSDDELRQAELGGQSQHHCYRVAKGINTKSVRPQGTRKHN